MPRTKMTVKQIKNLLPKKVYEGVALNRILSQHQLSRVRGVFGKLTIFGRSSKSAKVLLGISLILYLTGYQPVWAIPPIRQAVASAATTTEQVVEAYRLTYPFQLPHVGFITTRFSSWHPGLDIATGLGMPVRPITAGKVIEVVYGYFGFGHYVVVEHELGFKSTYGHMGRIFVKKDDPVSATSILGEVGMTGRTSGPHTHLEVTKDGKYVNPESVLPALQDWPAYAGKGPSGQGREPDGARQGSDENTVVAIPTPTPTPMIKKETAQKLNVLNLQELTNPVDKSKVKILKSLNYLSF